MNFSNLWDEVEELTESAVEAVVPVLLAAYLNKSAAVPGAPAITLSNVGKIAGTVAAAAALQHIAAAQQAAAAPVEQAPAAPIEQQA